MKKITVIEKFSADQIESLELSYQNFKTAINSAYDDEIDDFINFIDEKIDELHNDYEGEE